MSPWTAAAVVLLVALVPLGYLLVRAPYADALVALELAGTIVVVVLTILAQSFSRPSYYVVPLARLHYAAAGGIVGPLPVALAVLVEESFTQPAINALLIAGIMLVLGPLLAVETARAIRREEKR